MEIYNILNELNINYEELEHKAVYTIEEALKENIPERINGTECKNLFVKSKNGYYLIFLRCDKRADLKSIATIAGTTKFYFANEKELNEILGLTAGAVSPLGIINDKNNVVTILIDKELENKKVLVHPNINTKTISIHINDLIKLIDYTNHKYIMF